MGEVHGTLEATVSAAASKITGVGSGVTVLGWMTSSTFGMWVGIVIGIAGLAINWYFKRKNDKRAEEAHQVYMRQMRADMSTALLSKSVEADE